MFYSVIGKYVCLILVLLNDGLHLFCKKHGAITKSLLLPTLAAYYLCSCQNLYWPVIMALLLSGLGDVLLLKSGQKWFVAGGIGFMLSHLSFAICYCRYTDFSRTIWLLVLLAFAVYCLPCAIIAGKTRRNVSKGFSNALMLYLAFNACMNSFAFGLCVSHNDARIWTVYIGAVFFFLSDCFLFLNNFVRNEKQKSLPVMPAYIIGEFLITQGLIFASQM